MPSSLKKVGIGIAVVVLLAFVVLLLLIRSVESPGEALS